MKSIRLLITLGMVLLAQAAGGQPVAAPGIACDSGSADAALAGGCAPIALPPSGLEPGTTGVHYQQALAASGGVAPSTYAVVAGGLPAGLSLSSGGVITGTPSIAGKARFSIATTRLDGATTVRSFALVIRAATGASSHPPQGGAAAALSMAGGGMPLDPALAPAAALGSNAPSIAGGHASSRASALEADGGVRPDPSANAIVGGLQSADAEALKRLSAAQMRNVMSRLDSDVDCRPEWEQRVHLNTAWRDARPLGATESAPLDAADKPVCTQRMAAWAAGTVDYGRVGSSIAAAGSRFSTPGLTLGLDAMPLSGVRSGIALGRGQDHSDVGDGGGRIDSRTDNITAYSSWRAPLGLRLDAAFGQSRTTLSLQRVPDGESFAVQGQRRATQRYGALSGTARFDLGAWRVAPRMGVEHTRASIDAYAESDDTPLALLYDNAQLVSSNLHGGVALSRQWVLAKWKLEPELSVDWNKRLQGDTTQAMRYADDSGGASYTLSSAEPASELAQFGVGVRMFHPTGWSLSLGARSSLAGSAFRSAGYSAAVLWPF